MSLFKKRVSFPQFLAYLISAQCESLAQDFDKSIVLVDKFKVLTQEDKEQFFDKAHALLMVDIARRCCLYFSAHVSSGEIGRDVSIIYGKYLTEQKQEPKALVEQRLESLTTLIELREKAEEDTQTHHAQRRAIKDTSFPEIDDPIKAQQYYLCSGFAEYFGGQDMRPEGRQGKHFAAFKFAAYLVTGNIVAGALRYYEVTF